MSSDILRRAASRIREAASAAELSAHTCRLEPWRVEASVSVSGRGDLLDIVCQGDPFDSQGAVQYIADAETPEYATWIAMMSTHLAEPLAAMLEEAADRMDSLEAAVKRMYGNSPTQEEIDRLAEFLDQSKPSTALALARVILKEEETDG